ncbi:MAG TPA: hypothetical protein PK252_01205 [Bacteroidales bacterium]|nr:hypothetical protein [Bacteroidales bacterium]
MYSIVDHLQLIEKYSPSGPCSCPTCVSYCKRPGWWTIDQACNALYRGYAARMMLEISPDRTFGVLSPAFKGNEGGVSLQIFSDNGCTFLQNNLCELYSTGLQPLECRFCHHSRRGEGIACHNDIGQEWNSANGQQLVNFWYRNYLLRKFF